MKKPNFSTIFCSHTPSGDIQQTSKRNALVAFSLLIFSLIALLVMTRTASPLGNENEGFLDWESIPYSDSSGQMKGSQSQKSMGNSLKFNAKLPLDVADNIVDEADVQLPIGKVDQMDLNSPQALEKESKEEAKLEQLQCKSRRKEKVGLEKGPRAVYLHVPKTGGTSIQAALGRWAAGTNGRAVFKVANGPAFGRSSFTCPPKTLSATILAGHRGFGYCTDVEKSLRGMFVFTALRDPVSRVISLHDYNLLTLTTSVQNKATWEGSFKEESSLNAIIKQFNRTEEVESGEALLRYAASQQTRFMCGYECLGPNVRGNETYTDDYMLERAKQNLLRVDAMGVTERLDELITVLRLHLQFVPRGFHSWPEANTQPAKKKSKLDSESRSILENWARADKELYRLADQLAKKHYAEAKRCLTKIGDADAKVEVDSHSTSNVDKED